MFRYYHQENPSESDEIDWEMFIEDENERELTREVYKNIANHPDIPDKIYKKAEFMSKYEYIKPCVLDELYASDNMTPVICIACGLLFFYGKMIIEYYL
jgi:hypothetical protein